MFVLNLSGIQNKLYFVFHSVFLYLGAIFTGADAIKMGLADELYTVKEQSIRDAIGVS